MGLFDKFKKKPVPGPDEDLSDQVTFCLIPEPALQADLRRLKLMGSSTKLSPELPQGGDPVFRYGGKHAGDVPEPIRTWLRANKELVDFDKTYSSIVGGGHQTSGEPRPFTWFVRLRLKREAVHPKDELVIGTADWVEGFPSDCVCFLSKTKKIHTYPATCGASAIGLPMVFLDEVDMEKYSVCQKCFRSFW